MIVRVRVIPRSRKERFEEVGNNEFTAAVKEKPKRNEVNDRVQQLVARHFNVPVTSVRFLAGVRGKRKTFEVVQLYMHGIKN